MRLRHGPIGRALPGTMPSLAADERAGYDAGADDGRPLPEGPDPAPAGDLRAAVGEVRAAVARVRAIVDDRTVSSGGELAGLAELLDTLDAGHATAVALVDRIETAGLAERKAGLPLEQVLALHTKATFGDRRFLVGAREVLRHLPNVKAAFDARGARVGAGPCDRVRGPPADGRAAPPARCRVRRPRRARASAS